MKKFTSGFVILLLTMLCLSSNLSAQENPPELVKYYFVDLIPNPDKPEMSKLKVDIIQAAHMQNIGQMAKDGLLMLAGPFAGGGGIFILKVENMEAAQKLTNNDPAVKAGRLKTKIRPWYTGKGVFTAE